MPQVFIWHMLFYSHDAGSSFLAGPCFACLFLCAAGRATLSCFLHISYIIPQQCDEKKEITKLVKNKSRVSHKQVEDLSKTNPGR